MCLGGGEDPTPTVRSGSTSAASGRYPNDTGLERGHLRGEECLQCC